MATLRGTNLTDADLRDANLSRANLFGADLSDADLSGADLLGAPPTLTALTPAHDHVTTAIRLSTATHELLGALARRRDEAETSPSAVLSDLIEACRGELEPAAPCAPKRLRRISRSAPRFERVVPVNIMSATNKAPASASGQPATEPHDAQ